MENNLDSQFDFGLSSPTFIFENPPEEKTELTLRDPSFKNQDPRSSQIRNRRASNSNLPYPVIPEESASSYLYKDESHERKKDKSIDNKQGKSSLFLLSQTDISKSIWGSTGSFNEQNSTDRRKKSLRGDLSTDRLTSGRRDRESKSPSDRINRTMQESSSSKAKKENQSMVNLRELIKMNPSQPSSLNSSVRTLPPGKDNSLIVSMKTEIETLRTKLKAKEIQLNDNLALIENIQGHLKSDRGETVDIQIIQNLQKKAHELEKENRDLRESLHSEVLVSERQRSELEIVKEALNNQLGAPGMIQKNSRSNPNFQKTLKSDRLSAADILLEYEKLTKKLENYEQECASLKLNQNSLISKLKEYEEENSKLSRTLRELTSERQKLREDNENSIRIVSTTRAEQKKLEEEKAAILSYMNNEYLAEKTQLYDEINALKAENSHLQNELNKHITELSEKRASVDLLERERQILIETQQESNMKSINEKDQLIARLENELEAYRNEFERLESEQEKMIRKLQDYEKIKHEQNSRDKQYQLELSSLKSRLESTEREKEYENIQNDALEREQRELYEKRLQEVLKDRSTLQATCQALDIENKKLAAQKEDVQSKLNHLQSRVKDVEGHSSDIQHLRKEELQKCNDLVMAKEREVTSLKNEQAKNRNEIQQLRENMSQALEDLKMAKETVDTLVRDLENAKQINLSLQSELNDIKDHAKTMPRVSAITHNQNHEDRTTSSSFFLNGHEDPNLVRFREENEDLRMEISDLDEKCSRQQREIMQLKSKISFLEQGTLGMTKTIENYGEEKDKLENENKKLDDEIKSLRSKEGALREVLDDFLGILSSFVADLHKNPVTANNFLNNCTQKMRELLNSVAVKQRVDDFGNEIAKIGDYLEDWFITLLEEIEKDVLKIFKFRDENKALTVENEELKKKLPILSEYETHFRQARDELTIFKQEYTDLQQKLLAAERNEIKAKKDFEMLKSKQVSLSQSLEELRNQNSQLQNSLELEKRAVRESKALQETNFFAAKDLESNNELLLKERRQIEEIVEIIAHTIINPDLNRAVKDLISVQFEINKLEKGSRELEESLLNKESELKLIIKRSAKPSNDALDLRREVDKLRQDFQNGQSQLSIFQKRKTMLLEEIAQIERAERRRWECGIDIERAVAKVELNFFSHFKQRDEYNELKMKYEDLLQINGNLQARVKELMENNYVLHTESVKSGKGYLGHMVHEIYSTQDRQQAHLNTQELEESTVLRTSVDFMNNNQPAVRKSGEMRKNGNYGTGDFGVAPVKENENEEMGQKINSMQFPKIRLKDKLSEVKIKNCVNCLG